MWPQSEQALLGLLNQVATVLAIDKIRQVDVARETGARNGAGDKLARLEKRASADVVVVRTSHWAAETFDGVDGNPRSPCNFNLHFGVKDIVTLSEGQERQRRQP